jgi:flavocytochrome c
MMNSLVVVVLAAMQMVVVLTSSASADQHHQHEASSNSENICCGPLEDAKCAVADVERANVEQLHSILQELAENEYFQLFHLPTDRTCAYWHDENSLTSSKETSLDDSTDAQHHKCDTVAPPDDPFAMDASASSSSAAPTPPLPACAIVAEPAASTPSFPWQPSTDAVDRTITRKEDVALQRDRANNEDPNCTDNADLPSFWLDMCGAIDDSEAAVDATSTQFVSLTKNPERWTGYNGSDVWRAMYVENCFQNNDSANVDTMCYEERVLYRLLSGMHASINIHISKNYYPPRKGKRDSFEPNPRRYWQQFANHPERLRNLHFAFVVLLRAVQRGSAFLSAQTQYGERGLMLVRRLIDSNVLHSCNAVFSAFDESVLFSGDNGTLPKTHKQQFKHVFRNISSLFDCVTCQQCKLHGKLQLLGVGTALKLLLLPKEMISITRQEAVALFNTLAKFSDAIVSARELEEAARELIERDSTTPATAPAPPPAPPIASVPTTPNADVGSQVFNAVGALKRLARVGQLSSEVELKLLGAAIAREPGLLAVAWHYATDDAVLGSVLRSQADAIVRLAAAGGATAMAASSSSTYDAVVIGAGLSGLVCAVRVAERGGRVLLLEKEAFFGGNSAWASSGVNAVTVEDAGVVFDDKAAPGERDTVERYRRDTLKSGGVNESALIDVLTGQSGDALRWLRAHGAALPLRGRLGGHSAERTYRPVAGMAGTELIRQLGRLVEGKAADSAAVASRIDIRKKARAVEIVTRNGAIEALVYEDGGNGGARVRVVARNIVIATGGYAAARGAGSLLAENRPDLLHLGTTNGRWATGDGIVLARAAGADVINLHDVQVHPTAFVRKIRAESAAPLDAESAAATEEGEKPRTLCAEILRGVGGVLLDQNGKQFVDALETRKFIVENMMNHTARLRENAAHASRPVRADEFVLLLGASASRATSHVSLYEQKSLLQPQATLADVARWMQVDEATLRQSLVSAPALVADAPYHVGLVGPALHYTMGGIRIDTSGRVLQPSGEVLRGLWSVGEASGGIHGQNRLGGNALTECVVFGLAAGNAMPLEQTGGAAAASARGNDGASGATVTAASDRAIEASELAQHSTASSCWVSLYGKVYDFTDFLEEHPAGPQAILEFAGQDGTAKFEAVHNREMLEDFSPIGNLVQKN